MTYEAGGDFPIGSTQPTDPKDLYPGSDQISAAIEDGEFDSLIQWPHLGDGGLVRAWQLVGRTAGASAQARQSANTDPAELAAQRRARVERYIAPGAGWLAVKWEFIQGMQEISDGGLTMHVPRQLLAHAEEPLEQILEDAADFFPDQAEPIIVKPEGGSGASGIVEATAANLAELLTTEHENHRDVIAQERVPLTQEIRYAIWRRPGDPTTYRVVDDKTRAHRIVGDGQSTKRQLIRASSLSATAKWATSYQNKATRDAIVPEGATVHEAHIGIPHKADLEWGPKYRRQVQNVDRLMLGKGGVIPRIEAKIGHSLRRFCVDWGFEEAMPNEPATVEDMARISVPIEQQYPFTLIGYLVRSTLNPSGRRLGKD
ncbi:MAG TPA: hypothetical protein VGF75_06150 [Candidatus Saccharimonadales bacterium]|jgi:hypothetical protein